MVAPVVLPIFYYGNVLDSLKWALMKLILALVVCKFCSKLGSLTKGKQVGARQRAISCRSGVSRMRAAHLNYEADKQTTQAHP